MKAHWHLHQPLGEDAQPTAHERVLEVSTYWGAQLLEHAVAVSGVISAGPVSVRSQGDGAMITVSSDEGLRSVGRRGAQGVESLAPSPDGRYALEQDQRIAIQLGPLTYVVQFVRGHATMHHLKQKDWDYSRVFAISTMIHSFFVAAALITPQKREGLLDAYAKHLPDFRKVVLERRAPEVPRKLNLKRASGGPRFHKPQGRAGRPDRPVEQRLQRGAPRVNAIKRAHDREVALRSGLLGILGNGKGQVAVAGVLGSSGLGSGLNNAMRGLTGAPAAWAGGAGGMGTRGTDAGGGGSSLEIGGIGTRSGRGGDGYGDVELGGRRRSVIRRRPSKTVVIGGLKKAQVGRVIRRNLARFKHCYEKELNRNPNLAGKVAVRFTIAPTGQVALAKVSESSIRSSKVESCAVGVMRSLRFPKPRGGGVVVVTYPFFYSTNQ